MKAGILVGKDCRNGTGMNAPQVNRIQEGIMPGDNGTDLALLDTPGRQCRRVEFRSVKQLTPRPTVGRLARLPMDYCDRIRRLVCVPAPSLPDGADVFDMAHT